MGMMIQPDGRAPGPESRRTGAAVAEWNLRAGTFRASGSFGEYAMSRVEKDELLEHFAERSGAAPGDLACLREVFAAAAAGGPHGGAVLRLKTADGGYRWTGVAVEFFGDEAREPARVVVALVDLSPLFGTPEPDGESGQRRLQEERCRILSEHGNLVTFDYCPDTDTLACTLNTKQGEVRGAVYERYLENFPRITRIHPDHTGDFRAAFLRAKNAGGDSTAEFRADFLGTGYRWWRLRCLGLTDGNGRVFRVVGRADDIQAEKEREALLEDAAEQEASFRRSITSGAMIALEYDMKTGRRILTKSDAAPEDLRAELTLKELLAGFYGLLHPEDGRAFAGHFDADRIRQDLTMANRKISFDCRARSADGRYQGYRWVGVTYMYTAPLRAGNPHVLIYIVDIDKKKTSQLQLLDQIRRDPLTGLLNRSAFRQYFTDLIGRTGPGADRSAPGAAFALVSLDGMKQINDAYGHAFGDRLLQSVAVTLRAVQAESAARLGAAVFALCIRGLPDREVLHEQMRILYGALTQKREDEIALAASIGVSVWPADAESFDGLYEKADRALCRAKNDGGQAVFYSPELDSAAPPGGGVPAVETVSKHGKRVYLRTFGYFDVFVDGQAVPFRLAKAKELLALLVDRRGGFLSAGEAISFLWENEPADALIMSRYRKVAMRLKNILTQFGIEDIIESKNGLRRVVPERFDCDYYRFLSGRAEYRHLFTGAYLANYSWSEDTLSMLEELAAGDRLPGGEP